MSAQPGGDRRDDRRERRRAPSRPRTARYSAATWASSTNSRVMTPNGPMSDCFMMRSASSAGLPLPSPSAVSASPSRCSPRVSTAGTAAVATAASSGPPPSSSSSRAERGRAQPDDQPGQRRAEHPAARRLPVPAGDADRQHGQRAEGEAQGVGGGRGSGGSVTGGRLSGRPTRRRRSWPPERAMAASVHTRQMGACGMGHWWYRNIVEPGKLPLLLALASFVLTFLVTRAITRLIRAGKGPFRNVTPGGVHIHHVVPGVVLMVVGGFGAVGQRPARLRRGRRGGALRDGRGPGPGRVRADPPPRRRVLDRGGHARASRSSSSPRPGRPDPRRLPAVRRQRAQPGGGRQDRARSCGPWPSTSSSR